MQSFHPVIHLPKEYEVYDFSKGYDPHRIRHSPYGIGRYNEKRPGMYVEELFLANERNIHVGVDIAAPVDCPIYAFDAGEVYLFGYNEAKGDYGYTLITHHSYEGKSLYALHGHLSAASITDKKVGQQFTRGELLAFVGDKHENGGWNPHLHFQLSWIKPLKCDLPGVVSEAQREQALKDYPDPRLVLGPIY